MAAVVAVPKGRGLSEYVGDLRRGLPDDTRQADACRGCNEVVVEDKEEEGTRQEAETVAGCWGGGHPVLLVVINKRWRPSRLKRSRESVSHS